MAGETEIREGYDLLPSFQDRSHRDAADYPGVTHDDRGVTMPRTAPVDPRCPAAPRRSASPYPTHALRIEHLIDALEIALLVAPVVAERGAIDVLVFDVNFGDAGAAARTFAASSPSRYEP